MTAYDMLFLFGFRQVYKRYKNAIEFTQRNISCSFGGVYSYAFNPDALLINCDSYVYTVKYLKTLTDAVLFIAYIQLHPL